MKNQKSSSLLESIIKLESYQTVNNIPWLFSNPDYFFLYWQSKTAELINSFDFKIRNLLIQKDHTPYAETKARLEKLIKAYEYNAKKTEELMAPLQNNPFKEAQAFRDMIPSQQTLGLYWNNIFRDWSWESDENEKSIEIIKQILPQDWTSKTHITLGSGAGRLALDFHLKFSLENSFALDFNPLLNFVFQKMLQYQDLKFYEIPGSSIDINNSSHSWILKNPHSSSTTSPLQLLFGDIQDLPFHPRSFTSVLTPWVIDILPMSFDRIAERVNEILEIGGEWINFGPLGFMHANDSLCYSFQELKEILHKKGFEIQTETTAKVPYLQSPISPQSRTEQVIAFRAKKTSDTSVEKFQYLPNWLLDRDQPIPLTQEIKQHQILAKTNADVFFSLNGSISFNQIALLLSQHYQMPKELAQQTLMILFIKFHESQSRTLK